jgi:hypothetical protein
MHVRGDLGDRQQALTVGAELLKGRTPAIVGSAQRVQCSSPVQPWLAIPCKTL